MCDHTLYYGRKLKLWIESKIYTSKFQKLIVWSYGYKLVCVDGKFSNLVKAYLGKYAL